MIADAAPRSILDWFYTNAPASWFSALVAITTCVYVIWTRKKAKRIVIRETRNSSLIRIWPGVRQKIKVTFDDRNITTLGQIDADVFNEGSEVIQNPMFTLILPENSTILDTLITPVDLSGITTVDRNKVTITFPYLNPVREHKHLMKLSLLVNGETEDVKVGGIGEGWSVKHLRILTARQVMNRMMGFLVAFIIVSYLYGRFIESVFGIGMSEVSWRAVVSSLPLLLVIAVSVIWVSKWGARKFTQ